MIRSVVVLGLAAAASAAPAIVLNSASNDQIYKSSTVDIRSFIKGIGVPEEGKRNVVFVLGRTEDGAEALSALASTNKLPKLEARSYTMYPHVSELDTTTSIMRHVDSVSQMKGSAYSTPLEHVTSVLDSEVDERKFKSTVVVKVDPTDGEKVDDIVDRVASRADVSTVALVGLRSFSEVKAERSDAQFSRTPKQKNSGRRRRLEDQGADDDAYGGSYYDPSVYYVSMTPNIFSGILFTLFFIMTANIGFSCMGMIQGQEVFTDKSPKVGREA